MIQDYIIFTGVNIVLAWSVYVILLAGSLSFANGGFMAIGAYVSGVLTVKFGLPLVAAAALAGVAAGAVGVLVGFPALRTRGIYLMLVTVGIAVSVKAVIESIDYVGGVQGFGGMVGTTPWHVVALTLLVGCGLWLLTKSPLQRILDAVREDELVAGSLGINVLYVKLACIGIGAFLAAVAGSFYAHHLIHVTPDQFSITLSVFIVLYAVLGGTNNMWGPALGATIMTLLPEFVRGFESWRPTIFGVVILVLLLVRPDGLLSFRVPSTRAKSTARADRSDAA
ncbi:MAG: branched-chain amino acid ABC transporter permease [Pseudorhodoplanes sp.]|jgi:branched-chain amino acid transport system permease protein|nr:branched-chain amino acid ABC transporter permease [Pseudorhodoplanes sp.]